MATINVRMPDGNIQKMSHPDNWSDQQVQDAIYKHFPQQNTQSEPPEKRTGFTGIGQDIGEGVRNVWPSIKDFASSLPSEVSGIGSQLKNDPERLGLNLLAGLSKGVEGFVNTPSNIAQYLSSRDIGKGEFQDLIKKLRIDESGVGDLLGAPQSGDQLLQFGTSFLPYARMGGLSKGLPGLLKRAGAAGAYSAGQNENPVTGALTAALMEGGLKAGASLNPVTRLRGSLSADELAANLMASMGTNTPLGRVIESPTLSHTFENVTSQIPLTGSKLDKISSQIQNEANRNLEITKPENMMGDANFQLQKNLNKAFVENRKLKNNIYNERNDIANKEMFDLDLTNFNKMSSDLKEGIQGSAFYSIDPVFKRLFNKVSGLEKASDSVSQGKQKSLGSEQINQKGTIVSPTITESTTLARDLDEKGEKLLRSTSARDKAAGGLYKQLGQQLRDDINSSIENKGSDKLKEAHKRANKNYKENYLPFLDEDIQGTINKDNAESLVAEIIKPSKTFDRSEHIKNINKLLDPDQAKLLGHHYLSRAVDEFGNVDPVKLSSLIEGLGNRQFEALFPEKNVRESLKRFSRLRGMNQEALSQMHNPKTGARNAKIIAGLVGATIQPHKAAGILAGSALFNRIMTSPAIRDALVKRMLSKEGFNLDSPNNQVSSTGGNKKLMEIDVNQYKGVEGKG
jgi:hypothetical protein